MKCPICSAPIWIQSINTNHEPVHDWQGNTLGYVRGVLEATMRCVKGCEITVHGQTQYEALCRAIGR